MKKKISGSEIWELLLDLEEMCYIGTLISPIHVALKVNYSFEVDVAGASFMAGTIKSCLKARGGLIQKWLFKILFIEHGGVHHEFK